MNTTAQPDHSSDFAAVWQGILMELVSEFTAAELTEVVNAAIVVKTRRQA